MIDMAWYRTRSAAFGTMNTEAQMTADGSRGTVGNFVVPDGANSIQEINISVGDSARVLTACGGVMTLHLSGTGMMHGEQYIPFAGKAELDLGNCGKCFINPRINIPVKLAVISGMEIIAKVSLTGTDTGTPQAVVGFTFTSESVGKYIYVCRNGETAGGVAASNTIGTTWNGATVGNLNLAGYKRITKFITVMGDRTPLSSASGCVVDVVLAGSCLGAQGEVRLPCGAESVLDTTTGNSHGYFRPCILNTDVPVQSGILTIVAQQNGVDTGLPMAAVGLELEV